MIPAIYFVNVNGIEFMILYVLLLVNNQTEHEVEYSVTLLVSVTEALLFFFLFVIVLQIIGASVFGYLGFDYLEEFG